MNDNAAITERLILIEACIDAMTYHHPSETCCDIRPEVPQFACTRILNHADGPHVTAVDGWIRVSWSDPWIP